MKVSVTGATGNIGTVLLEKILPLDFIEEVKILIRPNKLKTKKIVDFKKDFPSKLKFIVGNMSNKEALISLIDNADVVINLAAIIPPHSDTNILGAIECNEKGVYTLVELLEKYNKDCLFIEMSSVAVYGNRNEAHPFVEVGDPLLISIGDIYALTKIRAEFKILESNLSRWVILRESAVLHNNLMKGNISDGIMFHTCFNSPLEWISANDTAILFKNILIKYNNDELDNNFYKHVFNVGNKHNRLTGYETFKEGFKMLNADTKDFFEPNFNSLRNFHGVWFRDSDKLENMFHFQKDTVSNFWDNLAKQNKLLTLGKYVPKKLIKKFVIERLFDDVNAPRYWINHNDEAKIIAYFYDLDTYNKIPNKFDKFPLFHKQKDYKLIKNDENYQRINLFYDINKDDQDITINDLINVAKAHNGELLSKDFKRGNIYQKLKWKNSDNVEFFATPYTILRAGHWYNRSYYEYVWDFDRLAKEDKIYASIWYDSHLKTENNLYYLDEEYSLKIKDNNK